MYTRQLLAGLLRSLCGAWHSAEQQLGVGAEYAERQAAHIIKLPPLTVLHFERLCNNVELSHEFLLSLDTNMHSSHRLNMELDL